MHLLNFFYYSSSQLKYRLARATAAKDKAEDEVKKLDRRLRDKDGLISALQSDRKELEDKVARLTKENEDLKNALDSAKYDLEQSELNRVDLQNRLQTAIEDLKFKKEMYDRVLTISIFSLFLLYSLITLLCRLSCYKIIQIFIILKLVLDSGTPKATNRQKKVSVEEGIPWSFHITQFPRAPNFKMYLSLYGLVLT